jgi:hypothetical protein
MYFCLLIEWNNCELNERVHDKETQSTPHGKPESTTWEAKVHEIENQSRRLGKPKYTTW